MFGNCCTSYDIPLQLVVHSGGKTHRFEGGSAIFDWHSLTADGVSYSASRRCTSRARFIGN